MSLEDLNEAVYKRDFKSRSRVVDSSENFHDVPESGHDHADPSVNRWADTIPEDPSPEKVIQSKTYQLSYRRKIILLLAIILLSLFTLGGILGKRVFLFDSASISVQMTGPEIVKTGDQVTLVIDYRNENWLGLNNAELVVSFPESFKPQQTDDWSLALSRATQVIPVIPGQSGGRVTLSGTLQAFEKKTAFFKAVLRSSPNGITNPTETIGQWTIAVDASALKLEVVGPPSLTLGQPLEYSVKYRNESMESIDNIQLVIEYPEGFTPTSFDPRPSRDENRWVLGRLDPKAVGNISIKGEVRGNSGDARRLIARLGKEQGDGNFLSLAQEEKLTKVLSPPLSVELTMNNGSKKSINPGEALLARVVFQNNSNTGIRDIVATVSLDEAYLNMAELTAPRGVNYDRSRQVLVFRASEVPELQSLEPGEVGEFSFGFKVRSDLAVLGRKNIEIRTKVILDSPDLPHGQNTEAFVSQTESFVKVNSPAKPVIQVDYVDSQFPNTGPFPPQVGQTTTYTVRLSASTELNTLNDARWTMALPSSTQFLDVLAGDKSTLRYNIRTGELVWDLGTLESGVNNTRQAVVRISFSPTPGASKLNPYLVNEGRFTAKDSFTGEQMELAVPHIATGHIVE